MADVDLAAVRRAYDRVGPQIEEVALRNPINAWMRAVAREEIARVMPTGASLIEIGCGSGADAVFFAGQGYRVTALDISPRMVESAVAMARRSGFEGRVTVLEGRLIDVGPELSRRGQAPFAGAYANYSLAYEESLNEIGAALYPLLRPGAPFVFTLPNRLCLTEMLIDLARGRTRGSLDRIRGSLPVEVRGERLRLRAYSPREVQRLLSGRFTLRRARGVPVFMPPPGLFQPRVRTLCELLKHADRALSASFPWNLLGDSALFDALRVP